MWNDSFQFSSTKTKNNNHKTLLINDSFWQIEVKFPENFQSINWWIFHAEKTWNTEFSSVKCEWHYSITVHSWNHQFDCQFTVKYQTFFSPDYELNLIKKKLRRLHAGPWLHFLHHRLVTFVICKHERSFYGNRQKKSINNKEKREKLSREEKLP